MRRPVLGQKGFSLIEVVIASILLAIVMTSAMKAFQFISKQSVRVDDRAFATEKAVQIAEELRGLVSDSDDQISLLDDYHNTDFKYTLSVLPEVNGDPGTVHANDRPAEPISSNASLKYKRKVFVEPIPGDELARRVYVRIYRSIDDEVLAETMTVLRVLRDQLYPTQVYDLFVLAIDNVPGWWVDMPKILPTFGNLIRDLQTRNPGLQFNVHYITRMAYGRDPFYKPTINTAVASGSNLASASQVYFYPGLLDTTTFYYSANLMGGMLTEDGADRNTSATGATYPYPFADQYNHAVRAPDEERMYRAAWNAAGAGAKPTISYRMLLDRMNAGPGLEPDGTTRYDYENALIINLHGELFPMPALRNYSDAAKLPETRPFVRAVSHPENLHYNSGQEVRLRVYSYVTKPENAVFSDDGSAVEPYITIVLSNKDVAATSVASALTAAFNIRKLTGHRNLDYIWQNAMETGPDDYDITVLSSTRTQIVLKNSPLRHRKSNTSNTGLATGVMDRRLYGLEYIPCVTAGTSFSDVFTLSNAPGTLAQDLDAPRNTARWVIRIPAGTLPEGMTTFETYVGSGTAVAISPANLSRTYVWLGPDTDVPESEKYQLVGDPRHMPYADVKAAWGYNWFYGKNINGTGYDSFVRSNGADLPTNGYGSGFNHWGAGQAQLNVDLPRFASLLRNGLLNTRSILSNVSGWLFYYVGLGGEIGLLETSRPTIHGRAYVPNDTVYRSVDEISVWSGGADRQCVRVVAHASNSSGSTTDWFSVPGLGDLYPDEAGATWRTTGNLPTGDVASFTGGRYFRAIYNHNSLSCYSQGLGQVFDFEPPRKQASNSGPGTLANGNDNASANDYFNQGSPANTANLTAAGGNVQDAFHLPLLSTMQDLASPSGHRPFSLHDNDSTFRPIEWSQPAYVSQRTALALLESYYNTNAGGFQATSGLIRMVEGGTRYAYLQPNGLGKQGAAFGATEIGKVSMVSLMRSFLSLGAPATGAGRIEPQPLVVITSPTATDDFDATVANVSVTWAPQWTRWDGQPYTEAYVGITSTTVRYNVKLSPDGGTTWTHLVSGAPATKDVYDPVQISTSPLTWPIGALPSGEFYQYILRVEGYSPTRELHHSYHDRRVYIRK